MTSEAGTIKVLSVWAKELGVSPRTLQTWLADECSLAFNVSMREYLFFVEAAYVQRVAEKYLGVRIPERELDPDQGTTMSHKQQIKPVGKWARELGVSTATLRKWLVAYCNLQFNNSREERTVLVEKCYIDRVLEKRLAKPWRPPSWFPKKKQSSEKSNSDRAKGNDGV